MTEAAPDAEANAQWTQREKLAAASDKVAKALQTYQSTVKAAHDSAAAAKRKLSAAPPKVALKPITPASLSRPMPSLLSVR